MSWSAATCAAASACCWTASRICYLWLIARKSEHLRNFVASAGTEITLEGFPRPANSFARDAFMYAQGRDIKVASHLHASSNVIRSVQLGLPTVVIIREPEEAILSYCLHNPTTTMRLALRRYISFYKRIAPYREQFLVATFPLITSDLGRIIRAINEKFGTTFTQFEHTEENLRAVLEIMNGICRRQRGYVRREWLNLPSEKRRQQKERFRPVLHERRYRRFLASARAIYHLFEPLALPVEVPTKATDQP